MTEDNSDSDSDSAIMTTVLVIVGIIVGVVLIAVVAVTVFSLLRSSEKDKGIIHILQCFPQSNQFLNHISI